MEIKGFTYGYHAGRGDYRTPEAVQSREALFDTGINYMCLAFPLVQDSVFSTEIRFDFARNCTDKDITAAIEHAHGRGIKVCLKPILNCGDGMWRAYINFPDANMGEKDIYWDKWFASYTAMLVHYAELAEDTGCEMFCVGCEMCGTERKEALWRETIRQVRKVYSGKLIYNTNHGKEDQVLWFDAVDYVGTSAYFQVGKDGKTTSAEMAAEWENVRDRMEKMHEKWQKPIVFIEIGCRSAKGCAAMPWDFTHQELPHDEAEQAAFYDSCLSVFSKEPWFGGMFWWDWSTTIYQTREEAKKCNGFNIHLKEAEQVIRKWYAKL